MIKINKVSNETIRIEESGIISEYHASSFFAFTNTPGLVTLDNKIGKAAIVRNFADFEVDGDDTFADEFEVARAINAIAGNFNSGGGTSGNNPESENKIDYIIQLLEESQSDEGGFVKSEDWAETELPEVLKTGTLYSYVFNGNVYIGSSTSGSGIWKFDATTKTFVQVYSTGYTWQYWKEFNGKLYVSGALSGAGILQLNSDETAFVQIYSTDTIWQYWKEFNGKLYVSSSSSSSSTGILQLNSDETAFVKIYSTGYAWQYWKEFNGKLYVSSSSSSGVGILQLNSDETAFVQIYSTSYYWQYWKEFNGKLYVSSSSSSSTGILQLNSDETAFVQIYSAGYNYETLTEYDKLISLLSTSQMPIYDVEVGLIGYQSGSLVKNYTLNSHGFISLDGKTTKKVFMSQFEVSSVAYLQDENENVFLFSSGSIIYSLN